MRHAAAAARVGSPRASRALRARLSRASLRARRSTSRCRRSARPAASRSATARALCAACWVEASLHRAALLRAARHSLRLRSRPRHPVDGGDRRSAGLRPRPRRGALRRRRAHAGACASSTATGSISRRCMGRWMARAGRELLARRRRARAGAAALAPAMGAALQPVGRARRARSSRGERRAGAARRAQARARRRRSRSGSTQRRARRATCRARSGSPPTGKAAVAGRRLVLVDDVLTSGATVDACARALLRAGAAQVDVLVFARVVDAGAQRPYK